MTNCRSKAAPGKNQCAGRSCFCRRKKWQAGCRRYRREWSRRLHLKRRGRASDRSRGAAGRFRWRSSPYQPDCPFVSGRLSAAPCGNQGSDPSRRCQCSGESSTRTKRIGNFAAKNALAAAQRLETMGRNGELETVDCRRRTYRTGIGTRPCLERTQKADQKPLHKVEPDKVEGCPDTNAARFVSL